MPFKRTPKQPDRDSCAEAVVPAEPLPECAADQRREECAEVDAHIEDREGAVPPRITRRVESSNLSRDIRLEGPVPEYQKQQSGEEERFDSHEEMADSHQKSAEDHCPALADDLVRENPSEKWRQVDQRSVKPVDLRG